MTGGRKTILVKSDRQYMGSSNCILNNPNKFKQKRDKLNKGACTTSRREEVGIFSGSAIKRAGNRFAAFTHPT